MVRRALLALLLLAGCPGSRTTPPAEPAVPPEPMGTAPDRDEDGTADDLDKCPDEAGTEDGCPSASLPNDRDADGVPDGLDRCVTEPEDKNGFLDDDGCPDNDIDRDGVVYANDICPSDAEDKDGFEDADGCPDPDNDRDGVLDRDDKCPSLQETRNGVEDDDGCPDYVTETKIIDLRKPAPPPASKPTPKPKPTGPADRDKDGIIDDKDRCPDEPESINGKKDGDGCPD